jgi:quercetin dioxygenase-like cupin family protein
MKNSLTTTLTVFFAVACVFCLQSKAQSIKDSVDIFAKGALAPATNFTGTVHANMLVDPKDGVNIVSGVVTFEPGARSNWHSHSGGQVLFVTEGTGYYQEKGRPVQLITKGNVVVCKPGTTHWHGASKDRSMTHIATVPEPDREGATVWLLLVTNQEYNYKN